MTETDLQQLAERGAAELEGASADDLLRWTDENFGGDYVVASNMQDAVLVSTGRQGAPGSGRAVPRHRLPLRGDHRHP